jgi:restriction system protein
MALWMVRAGGHGEDEQTALDNGLVTIGWNDLGDLSRVKSKDELMNLYVKAYPDEKKRKVANAVGQIWSFLDRIKAEDLVALPLKHRSAIAIGKVTSPYRYRTDLGDVHHTRKVKWVRTDIPRSDFDQDLLYSFGAFMTVCQITRNNAEERVRSMLMGKKVRLDLDEAGAEEEAPDIEQISRDQVLKYVDQKFKGHDLARLVEAVIQAQGYVTKSSPPGPDGGVDILAGAGPMGFDHPRICVQVKSASSPADVTTLRSLQGTMQTFKADQGLLVSWSGFRGKVEDESRLSFFSVRLWDSGTLLDEVLKYYDKFPDSLKAELPLKRIWSLVPEE